MLEDQYFLKVGECNWINPFPGNITFAQITRDFDGNEVLDIHFVSGQEIRWRKNQIEAEIFITWLNHSSIDTEKRNAAWNKMIAENEAAMKRKPSLDADAKKGEKP